MKPVVVLSEAAEDIEQAKDFYDQQDDGLGEYFSNSIIADIESLELFHDIHPKHHGFYRMLASRFPFGIYYESTSVTTFVFAILDLRRDPLWIHQELRTR